ncbi:MAG TPA: mannitol dehydrogenase family protein [Solirubrobacteraceae bacterium]|nr:mannitol dehydrogenase family protein [Solirubrobacteraceae bacterium]
MQIPTYDRAALTPSVVHMSVGSFHRSHQAVYFDDLAQRGISREWGLTGVGLHRRAMRDVLSAQDGLYTVVSRGAGGDEARIVGVITDYLFAPEEADRVLDALAAERTQLVTLTITAGGYKIDAETGAFAAGDAAIAADLAQPHHPCSALGFLVEALDRRRRAGLPGFTVLSCDNMPANGAIAQTAVVALARLRDERLARWIEQHVAFPSSMVDRITPKTTPQDRAMVAHEFGIRDRWPVITEPFSQWIVEDTFCNGRPPLDEVGVQFVDDVRPYALMKTRLLNASHSALGYLGSLAGHDRTNEAIADPVFAGYVERMMRHEIAPLLPPVSGIDLIDYQATLLERFANPAIGDRLSRLCRNGSSKVPGHVLSSIREARLIGRPHRLLTLAVAGWVRYLRGVDEDGRPLTVDDPAASRLGSLAPERDGDPRALLADKRTFGSLGGDPGFAAAVELDLRSLDRHGARAVVSARAARAARVGSV